MSFHHHPALCCPLDRLPLHVHDAALRCENGHSFDIARRGYANLLAAQDKRSRDPGDSRDMVAARQRFLQAGHYLPIAECLIDRLRPYFTKEALIVDAGCGEGFYLHRVMEAARDSGWPGPAVVGLDISKWAVQAAARRFPATWLVASNRNIPLVDASADVVVDMFGFPDFDEFARVLKPSGILLRVSPGDEHLLELRQVIYDRVKIGDRVPADPANFSRIHGESLRYGMPAMTQEEIADLLLMTPHLFRASREGRESAAALTRLDLRVDVSVEVFRKKGEEENSAHSV